MRILVTGGTAVLGSHLLPLLRARGHDVRVLTRQENIYGGVAGDLETGSGLAEACSGVDLIIHLASTRDSKKWRQLDVAGTARLAAAARRAGVQHMLYVSIIGVDEIPSAYYRAKHDAEGQLKLSGVPYTIVRVAQFHELVDSIVRLFPRVGFGPIARFPFPAEILIQPIAAADAAEVLANRAELGPSNTVETLAGPEILDGRTIAEQHLQAQGKRAAVVNLPLAGEYYRGAVDGRLVAPSSAWPGQTFREFAAERAATDAEPAYTFELPIPSLRKKKEDDAVSPGDSAGPERPLDSSGAAGASEQPIPSAPERQSP